MKPFDATGAFQPSGNGDGLRRIALHGTGISVFAQGAVFAIQMIATIVLARLLTAAGRPEISPGLTERLENV